MTASCVARTICSAFSPTAAAHPGPVWPHPNMLIDTAAMQSPWLTWTSLTWFGDSALLLPAALLLGLALLASRGSRILALRWGAAFGSAGLLVLVTKIAFIGWGIGIAAVDFTGLSGHSALSATFWPVAGWMATQNRSRATRVAGIAVGCLFALGIGVSRVVLEMHSVSEVVSGLLLGFVLSSWFLRPVQASARLVPLLAPVALVLVVGLIVMQHGRPAPTTQLVEATVVRALGKSAPFTRRDLHLRGFQASR